MIENFSDEEISQILKELGITKKPIPRKSIVLAEQKARISRIFTKELYPGTDEKRRNGLSSNLSKRTVCKEIFNNIITIIDYTTGNLVRGTDKYQQPEYHRSTTITEDAEQEYKEMFDEILDVVAKHYR